MPVLIAGHYNLGVFGQGFAVFAAGATRVPRPSCEKIISPVPPARIGLITRPNAPTRSIVRRVKLAVVLHQELHHEPENDCRSHQPETIATSMTSVTISAE